VICPQGSAPRRKRVGFWSRGASQMGHNLAEAANLALLLEEIAPQRLKPIGKPGDCRDVIRDPTHALIEVSRSAERFGRGT